MSKDYDSIEEYFKDLKDMVPDAMLEYVAPRVEKVLRDFTYRNVYQAANLAGRPRKNGWVNHQTYHRRYALPDAIESRIEGDEMITTSTAAPSPSIMGAHTYGSEDGAFYDLLELEGSSLDTFPISHMFPRPVIGPAQRYVDMITPSLTNILIKGLGEMLG